MRPVLSRLFWMFGWMLCWGVIGGGLLGCAPEGQIQIKVVPTSGQTFSDAQRMTFELTGEGLAQSPIKQEFDFSNKNATVPSFAIKQDTDKPWFDMNALIFDGSNNLIALGQARLPFVSKSLERGILISRVHAFGWLTEISDGSQSLLPLPLVGHRTVALSNGLILIVGGSIEFKGNGGVYEVTQADFLQKRLMLYNPQTGLIEFSAASLANPRAFHTATVMGNGLVVIAGGLGFINNKLTVLNSVEIYDPKTDTLRGGNSMKEARAFHTATRVGDSEVVMVGGLFKPLSLGKRQFEQGLQVLKIENYLVGEASETSKISGSLLYPPTQNGCPPFPSADKITEVDGRWLHQTSRLTDTLLLVTGGLRIDKEGKREVPSHAILLQRSGECWRPKKVEKENVYARYEHTSTVLEMDNGRRWVVVTGGRDANNQLVGPVEIWGEDGRPAGNAGKINRARFGHTAIALPNQQLLLIGGMGTDLNADVQAEFYTLDLSGGARLLPVTVRTQDDLKLKENMGRFYSTAALSPVSPRVVIVGGSFREKVTDPEQQKDNVWTFRGHRSAEIFTYAPASNSN